MRRAMMAVVSATLFCVLGCGATPKDAFKAKMTSKMAELTQLFAGIEGLECGEENTYDVIKTTSEVSPYTAHFTLHIYASHKVDKLSVNVGHLWKCRYSYRDGKWEFVSALPLWEQSVLGEYGGHYDGANSVSFEGADPDFMDQGEVDEAITLAQEAYSSMFVNAGALNRMNSILAGE